MPRFISLLDKAIQAHVDETAFFLMRVFRVGKSGIRLTTLNLIGILSIARGFLHPTFGVPQMERLYCHIVGWTVLFVAFKVYRHDVATEKSPDTMSPVDAQLAHRTGMLKAATIFVIFIRAQGAIIVYLTLRATAHRFFFQEALNFGGACVVFIFWYLVHTPFFPPPQKIRHELKELIPIRIPASSRHRNDYR